MSSNWNNISSFATVEYAFDFTAYFGAVGEVPYKGVCVGDKIHFGFILLSDHKAIF